MRRDDVMRLAREAGLHVTSSNACGLNLVARKTDSGALVHLTVDELLPFVALVVAAEREACAEACDSVADKWQAKHNTEREDSADECAIAIRARGST
jgi:hypothetical protein